jgi:hypothetical protein
MHKIVVSVMFLGLAGCTTPPPPIVEMAGKDPVQLNRDMAECRGKDTMYRKDGYGWPLPFPQSRCLEDKGYVVLSRTQ